MALAQTNAEFGQLVSAVMRLPQAEFERFVRRVITYEKKEDKDND